MMISKKDYEMKAYLQNKRVLITDCSNSFTSVIHRTLVDLGVEPTNIRKESDFNKACHSIKKKKPEIVLSEYKIGSGYGLELANLQVEQLNNFKNRIFILVSSNANGSAVAEAAEEEIDGYILKPFTLQQLTQTLSKVIRGKMSPSPYHKTIQQGKSLLKLGEYEEAEKVFTEAIKLDSNPSLASYYQGLTRIRRGLVDAALDSYRSGRKYNLNHYKCLLGEFDILFEREQHLPAYGIIKTINEHFPVSPGTLSKMFKLAIFTQNYRDIEKYYNTFLKLDSRNPELVKVTTAGMIAGGKFALKEGDVPLAVSLFKKGAATAQRDIDYLERVIVSLLKHDCAQEAEQFLKMFLPEQRETPQYVQLDYKVAEHFLDRPKLIEKCRKIILDGLADEEICIRAIEMLAKEGKDTAAENIIYKVKDQFPDLKNTLYKVLEKNLRLGS